MTNVLAITHRASLIEARARVAAVARRFDADPTTTEELRIAVSELAQNILDHGAGRGELEIRGDAACRRIELTATDFGHGISFAKAARGPRPGGGGEGLPTLGRLCHAIGICRGIAGGTQVQFIRYMEPYRPGGKPKVAWFKQASEASLVVQLVRSKDALQVDLNLAGGGPLVAHIELTHAPQQARAETTGDMFVSQIRGGMPARVPGSFSKTNRSAIPMHPGALLCFSNRSFPVHNDVFESPSFLTTGIRLAASMWTGSNDESGILLIAGLE